MAPPPAGAPMVLGLTVVDELPGMDEQPVKKDLVYAKAGDRELALDVYIPEVSRRRARVPAVVMVHGQAPPPVLERFKDTPSFSSLARYLAATGLVVVVPNLGSAAMGPAPEQWWAGVARVEANAEAAIDYARAHASELGIDPDNVCVAVFSAGGTYGFRAALGGARPHVKCVVGLYPLLDDAPLRPHLPPEARAGYSLLETVKARGAKLPPILLVRAGKDDPGLNRALDAVAAEAKKRRAPVTVVSLPDAHHGFEILDDDDDSRRVLRQVGEFINAHLGP
jgi:dienelactone hydrolase